MIQTIDFRWRNVPFPYRCDGCPYPRVGFACRDRDGNCTRTDVEKLTERQRSIRESLLAQKECVR